MNCEFESKKGCKALGCLCRIQCSCRDEKGNPKYIWKLKRKIKNKEKS